MSQHAIKVDFEQRSHHTSRLRGREPAIDQQQTTVAALVDAQVGERRCFVVGNCGAEQRTIAEAATSETAEIGSIARPRDDDLGVT